MNKPIQARIPRTVRRLPILRDIRQLQYSEESDVAARTGTLRRVFPHTRIDTESIGYTDTCVFTMSARVGSTALLRWLQSAGLSRHPIHEIFNTRGPAQAFVEKWQTTSLCQYLNRHATLCGNDRLLFKTGWWDMAPFLRLIDDELDTWLPDATWIHLERRDKVAQAYSLWKLAKFSVNHRQQGETYTSPVTREIPIDGVRERLQLIELENACWKRFFDEHAITPHFVDYEDFVDKPLDTMTRVYALCASTPPDTSKDCPLVRTTDDTDLANVEYLRARLA